VTILFFGDLFGRPGLRALRAKLPSLIDRHRADFTVVNVENAADGYGVTPDLAAEVLEAGADCLTTGNHAFDRREGVEYLDAEPRLIRPYNYPPECPGSGLYLGRTPGGVGVGVVNLMGRVHMGFVVDCPFRAADAALEKLSGRAKVFVVDMHAEVTSEKAAMGWHLDGRASAVIGTHTHVPTADERVLPGGTAYITDVGMVGPEDGVIGGDRRASLRRFLTQMPGRVPAATGRARIDAVVIDVDESTGRARSIARVSAREEDA